MKSGPFIFFWNSFHFCFKTLREGFNSWPRFKPRIILFPNPLLRSLLSGCGGGGGGDCDLYRSPRREKTSISHLMASHAAPKTGSFCFSFVIDLLRHPFGFPIGRWRGNCSYIGRCWPVHLIGNVFHRIPCKIPRKTSRAPIGWQITPDFALLFNTQSFQVIVHPMDKSQSPTQVAGIGVAIITFWRLVLIALFRNFFFTCSSQFRLPISNIVFSKLEIKRRMVCFLGSYHSISEPLFPTIPGYRKPAVVRQSDRSPKTSQFVT